MFSCNPLLKHRKPSHFISFLLILSGPVHDSSEGRSTHVNIAETHVLQFEIENESNEASLESQVCKFWELEGIGISKNETTVYESFKDEITFSDGRYEVKLPWKPEHPTLPDNYPTTRHCQTII